MKYKLDIETAPFRKTLKIDKGSFNKKNTIYFGMSKYIIFKWLWFWVWIIKK